LLIADLFCISQSAFPLFESKATQMRLLVSVADAQDAAAALAGGADFIDAKDPLKGALGPVALSRFCEIRAACQAQRPLTAALGDAVDESAIEESAREFVAAGAALVKIGFAGIESAGRLESLVSAAVRGAEAAAAGRPDVVVVTYADADPLITLPPSAILCSARKAGASGMLIDTADKAGPGLRTIMAPPALATWIAATHDAGLFAAVAGRLTASDLPCVRDAGADVAGVRGAACDGGRQGRVSPKRVRELQAWCKATAPR
jgi:uncharacterized protein (UPF0264 family)